VYLEGGSTRLQVVDGATLNTGDSHEYCIRANGGPMKVTLVGIPLRHFFFIYFKICPPATFKETL